MSFWDFCAPFYDIAEKANRKARDGMISQICERIRPDSHVLELAAGTGEIGLAAAKKARDITITDVSENMLHVARRKAKRLHLTNVVIQPCDVYDTHFGDNAFDIVIAAQILHLLDDPAKAAAELRRIGTTVIVPVCLLKDLRASAKFKVALFRLAGFSPKQEFDEKSYRAFLAEIGLPPTEFAIADGAMPLAVAVWRK
jgi:ubiquinone/menaquinone biosynthesis C-methylase UbiE